MEFRDPPTVRNIFGVDGAAQCNVEGECDAASSQIS